MSKFNKKQVYKHLINCENMKRFNTSINKTWADFAYVECVTYAALREMNE